ncbi:MAG: AIR synthase-related protein [bacterium]|nr:AIR synthase-related protein [bacterium]
MPVDKPEPKQSYDTSQPFLERIEAAVERTRTVESPYVRYRPDGSYVELGDWPKLDSSDTIGTKADLHWRARTFAEAAQDAFAMNANDLYRDRAVPYKLLNTLMIGREDHEAIAKIVEGLSDLSVARGIQMGSGETAILDTMDGFELDVTMTGAVIDDRPNRYERGDVLIGIPSSGIHSNGLTDARRLLGADTAKDVRPELLVPTRVYDEIPGLLSDLEVHGLTHVTGGGLSKIHLDGDLDAVVERALCVPPVFEALFERWVAELEDERAADQQMYLKFNNGTGFVLGVPKGEVAGVMSMVPDAEVIGGVIEGTGTVRAKSHYTGRTIEL